MPTYRVHRIKHAPGESFRWTTHTGGLSVIKFKDYESGEEITAASPYAGWKLLASAGKALNPGDVLELIRPDGNAGELYITKYIGFEPAEWFIPEPKPETVSVTISSTAAPNSIEAQE